MPAYRMLLPDGTETKVLTKGTILGPAEVPAEKESEPEDSAQNGATGIRVDDEQALSPEAIVWVLNQLQEETERVELRLPVAWVSRVRKVAEGGKISAANVFRILIARQLGY